jgi:arachidonate 15-lipoxygenase
LEKFNTVDSMSQYNYNYNYIEPLAMVDTLPPDENFSFPWIVLTAKQVIKLAINTLVVNLDNLEPQRSEDDVKAFLWRILLQTLQTQGTSSKLKLLNALPKLFPQPGVTRAATVFERELPGVVRTHEDIAIAVPRGIETALAQLLAATGATGARGDTVAAPVAQTPLQAALQNVPSTAPEVEAEVSANVKAGLQQQSQILPGTEDEVEQFVGSKFIQDLGIDFLKLFAQNTLAGLTETVPTGKATSLEQYRQLFAYIPLPEIADTFASDLTFASMRVAGPNPVLLTRMTAADLRFPVTESQYRSVMGADSLGRAIDQGRVYITDYAVLAGAVDGTFGTTPQTQKFAYAPLAMFAVPPTDSPDRSLLPIAIQCGQSPTEYPVITPATGAEIWLMAKTVVQIADANFHEAIAHFARTHLFVEPFVIATHRQLAVGHPLYQLLVPHFQGTLAINFAAHESLVAPKGGVNDLLSSTIDNSRLAFVKGFQAQGFNASMLPRQLRDRGVDDPTALPSYPYRDDGLLVWSAIQQWVGAYLGLFYGSDTAVTGDTEIQNWAAELVAFDGARLQDFGDRGDGQIATLAYLVDAVTTIIFTASAQHAAVNFPQSSIMSYAPAMPTAGYASARSIAAGSVDLFDLLPPLDQAQSQLNLVYLLGSVSFTQLGVYDDGHFTDPRVAASLQAFQQRLQAINEIVDQRNQNRPVYDCLKPAKIPQSINI